MRCANRPAEAQEARRKAELASLAKSQFLAAASHDLRQPLYALSLFSASLDELKLDARRARGGRQYPGQYRRHGVAVRGPARPVQAGSGRGRAASWRRLRSMRCSTG